MRENPGVTAGEGVSFRDRGAAGFDGPGFELWCKVGAVEQRNRETRGRLSPIKGIKAMGEILPWSHRRTPFPDAEPALTCPPRPTGKPGRTEVMEEREEHETRAGGPEGWTKDSAKVQIGAELLCKSAKVKPTSGDG